MAKVYLFFLSGSKKGKIDAADAQVVRIGRQPYCEVPLDPHLDLPASGDHAQIVSQGGGTFILYDSNSSWGTFKNGERLTSVASFKSWYGRNKRLGRSPWRDPREK